MRRFSILWGGDERTHKNLDIHSDLTDREVLCSFFLIIRILREGEEFRGERLRRAPASSTRGGPCKRVRVSERGPSVCCRAEEPRFDELVEKTSALGGEKNNIYLLHFLVDSEGNIFVLLLTDHACHTL